MGSKKYIRKKPTEPQCLTAFCPSPGEYVLFDANRAYLLQVTHLRSYFHNIVLSKVSRASVFESDYMCVEHELFNTTIYDVEGRATSIAVETIVEDCVNKTIDIDNPIELAFQLGGTVLNRTPVSTCAYPMSELH